MTEFITLPVLPTITLGGVGLVALVGAAVFVVNKGFAVSTRWLPLVSVLIGLLFGLLAYFADGLTLAEALVNGGLVGLIASGAYDVGKKTLE